MAREEAPREDLLREAVALVRRAELRVEGFSEPVVVGFRRNGAASVFIGQEVTFQFTTANEFRRGYLDGRLLKAERQGIVALTRQRTGRQVQLVRHEFDESETEQYLGFATSQLTELRLRLTAGQFVLIGQVPQDTDVVAEIVRWLDTMPGEIRVANSPGVR